MVLWDITEGWVSWTSRDNSCYIEKKTFYRWYGSGQRGVRVGSHVRYVKRKRSAVYYLFYEGLKPWAFPKVCFLLYMPIVGNVLGALD